MEIAGRKVKSTLFPGAGGVVIKDWCIIFHLLAWTNPSMIFLKKASKYPLSDLEQPDLNQFCLLMIFLSELFCSGTQRV